MNNCLCCNKIIKSFRRKKFCSRLYRLTYCEKLRIAENINDFKNISRKAHFLNDKNFNGQPCKSFVCCENGSFYSPYGYWGKILICDECNAKWYREGFRNTLLDSDH